jgi:quercetin dioxygenase-like cupin family protein
MSGRPNVKDAPPPAQFKVFRASEAVPYEETGVMSAEPISAIAAEGAKQLIAAGYLDAVTTKLLFAAPGFSLTHLWFKSGAPLPRHSHNCDCLYYIAAGSLRIGTHELAKGDGFFVGAEVPYAYEAGPEGVEVLEFRASDRFNIRLMADNPAFWTRAAETSRTKAAAWATEEPPSGG